MTEVEERARKICAEFGADPDEVIDDYGPVLRWDGPGYHLNEIKTDAEEEERDRIVEWLREQADKGDLHLDLAIKQADTQHQKPEIWAAGVVAVRNAADAISRGEHMKGSTND